MSASFASVATGGYVPPLAATTAAQVAATATAAVAATMTGGRASVATGYVPPLATGSQTAGSTATFSYAAPITWSTNSPIDTDSFLYYFVEPYLDAHQLSRPSWRYAYILWFLIGGVFIGWSLAHQFGERGKAIIGGKGEGGDGVWAATWRKWSVRRINFKDVKKIDGGQGKRATIAPGKKRRLPSWSGPTVAQVITVLALLAWTFVMAYLGPDYLNPTTCTFGGTCPVAVDQGPPKSTFASSSRLLVRRSEHQGLPALPRSSFPRLALSALSKRQGVSSDKTLNPDGWAPFNDPLLAGPNYDVYKSWWTSSNRLGLIGFALLPLVVTLALKYWPFNIFATPFLTNYGFDKTAMLHRWIGRIVWLFSTLHVATWSVQLFLDKDPYGKSVWFDVWLYYKFIGGVVAYAILTLLIFLSFNTFRSRYYEFFHFSHMVLSLIFLVGCIVHYPPLATWAIIALALWGAERAYRLAALAWINGIGMKIVSPDVAKRDLSRGHFRVLSIEKVPGTHIVGQDVQYNNLQPNDMSEVDLSKAEQEDFPDYDGYPAHSYSSRLNARRAQRATVFAYGQGQDLLYPQSLSDGRRPHSPSAVMLNAQQPSEQNLTAGSMNDTDAQAMARKESSAASTMINLPRSIEARQDATIVPPPGYALVQLLPGRTMRLTIRTPRTVKWRPGQHILLTVPSVRLFESHPYTIANADERDPDLGGGHMLQGGDVGSTIYLIVRARKGFTRALWQKVVKERRETQSPKQQSGADEVEHGNGVMIRACVGLPMGSSARANWHSWRTLVIVCGGAGVSFGIALLDYICRAMATRDADRQANERRDSKRTSRGDGKPSAKQRESPVKTTRVRFVWILKEYAHLAWIAPTLRRCMELVPPEQLRVDLFVSSARGIIPAAQHRPSPLNDDHAGLLPPTPGFARKQAGSSRESLDTTMSEDEDSDNEGPRRSGAAATSPQRPNAPPNTSFGGYSLETPDADESALDYVMFEGEDEERTRGEQEVSQQVRREGKLRRALSRRAAGLQKSLSPAKKPTADGAANDQSYNTHEYPPPPGSPGASRRPDRNGRPTSSASLGSFMSYDHPGSVPPTPGTPSFMGFKRQDSDMNSISVLLSQQSDPRMRDEEDDVWLDIEGQDREDLDAVAELTRTGKPRIGAILDEEVDRSQGATMVACCGPLSLNTLVRALVSDRIHPSRVARGDSRGSLGLVCEDFTI